MHTNNLDLSLSSKTFSQAVVIFSICTKRTFITFWYKYSNTQYFISRMIFSKMFAMFFYSTANVSMEWSGLCVKFS